MRRLLMIILCLLLLTTAVSAADTVSDLQSSTTISDDGSCQVVLTMVLQLDEKPDTLYFPLPRQAIDISLNGSTARTNLSGQMRNVDLAREIPAAGTYTMVLRYTLPDAVSTGAEGELTLQVPLLSGFSLPVQKMSFSITLPGKVEKDPAFTSTYHLETIESFLRLQISGATVSGSVTEPLKDHESLTMTMAVTEEMFPQPMVKQWSLSMDDVAMTGFAILAVLYWFASMRTPLPRQLRRTKEPAGLTAGELGCCLTGKGVDFTMMVVSWAQMGYLLIQLDDNGRVLLHKRMNMGNERSSFEVTFFRKLFGSRRMIDGSGFHYAQLCQKAAFYSPGKRSYFLKESGNPYIFRILVTVVGLCGGISMAYAFSSDTAWRTILSILLGLLTVAASWQIQNAGYCLQLRGKLDLWLGILCGILWIGIGFWAGEVHVAILIVLAQFIGGIAAAYGGRRTELGTLTRDEIIGLRRHLRTVTREELRQILRRNPDYYHQLVPYAVALGVDRSFARQFGSQYLPECTYLTTGMDGHLTAREFNRLLRAAVSALDEQQKARPWEKFLRK